MRYALVDLDGAVRERFSSPDAVREALREIERDDPAAPAEFYVLAYNDAGEREGEAKRGDEMIGQPAVVYVGTTESVLGALNTSKIRRSRSRALDWTEAHDAALPT